MIIKNICTHVCHLTRIPTNVAILVIPGNVVSYMFSFGINDVSALFSLLSHLIIEASTGGKNMSIFKVVNKFFGKFS